MYGKDITTRGKEQRDSPIPPESGASIAISPDPVEALREGFTFLRLERVDREKNVARFYELCWTPTLLGWAVVRRYGRIGRSQRTLISPFPDKETAWPLIRALVKRRLRHGYRVTAPAEATEKLLG